MRLQHGDAAAERDGRPVHRDDYSATTAARKASCAEVGSIRTVEMQDKFAKVFLASAGTAQAAASNRDPKRKINIASISLLSA